jgi:hypothetical protein
MFYYVKRKEHPSFVIPSLIITSYYLSCISVLLTWVLSLRGGVGEKAN